MKLLTRFVVLAGISGLAACASEGPATSTGTGAGQSAPATSSAANTSQSAPASAAAASAPAQKDKFVTPSGYKHVQVNGEDRYCRKEVATGTRAQTTEICLTQDQLAAEKDESRDLIQGVQHNQGTAIYSQPNGAY
jgi:hypothetical protein